MISTGVGGSWISSSSFSSMTGLVLPELLAESEYLVGGRFTALTFIASLLSYGASTFTAADRSAAVVFFDDFTEFAYLPRVGRVEYCNEGGSGDIFSEREVNINEYEVLSNVVIHKSRLNKPFNAKLI